jgi:hypothetical protein
MIEGFYRRVVDYVVRRDGVLRFEMVWRGYRGERIDAKKGRGENRGSVDGAVWLRWMVWCCAANTRAWRRAMASKELRGGIRSPHCPSVS